MSLEFSRRELLAATSLGLVAPRLFGAASPGPVCLSMIYINGRDVKFNAEHYREQHVPLLRRALGDSIERIELRTAPRPERGSPMPASPVAADISMWIRDIPAFAAATQRSGTEINEDLAKISSSRPVAQYDQVIGEWGKPRDAVGVGVESVAMYYPNSEGAKWDADYYVNTYLPKLVAAYGGDDVLRRVEVRRGVGAQGGGQPAMINSVHLYAASNSRFPMAGMGAAQRLMNDAKLITTIFPYVASMKVQAAG
jgi:uncharacterized protein (TIGR02118 family)